MEARTEHLEVYEPHSFSMELKQFQDLQPLNTSYCESAVSS